MKKILITVSVFALLFASTQAFAAPKKGEGCAADSPKCDVGLCCGDGTCWASSSPTDNGSPCKPHAIIKKISWNPSPSATSYNIQISDKTDFSNVLVNRTGLTATSFDASYFAAGTYYYRLQAVNAVGASAWTPGYSFVAVADPASVPTVPVPTSSPLQPLALSVQDAIKTFQVAAKISVSGYADTATLLALTKSLPVDKTLFIRDLTVGSTGADVAELQKVLIQRGYMAGPVPTMTFATGTANALCKMQVAAKITTALSSACGKFGPMTRAYLMK